MSDEKSDPPFPLHVVTDAFGKVEQVTVYGRPMLDTAQPCQSELWVNGLPLEMRGHVDPNDPGRKISHLKGERFINHFCGWSLVLARKVGPRPGLKHPCVGIQSLVRREVCDQTVPCPGPGGPVTEGPLHVDTFSLLNWNWQFWGEDTRMIFTSTHANGPADQWGHVGHEHDTPEKVKAYMQNMWRRVYPGCMLVHGGLFYDARTGQWLAITCRQPQVGYHLNITDAGRGVGYDFTLHAPFNIGQTLTLPEIKLYCGPDQDSMMRWLADYATHYYEEPPQWVSKKLWGRGLSWDNQATWTDQADHWERQIQAGRYNAIGYSLVTNRPIRSGTTPTGYEPDPNHGSIDEFRAMCHRMADAGVPVLIWMSHSGLCYRGGDEIDDDWFIRGVDGRISASWGSIDHPELAHINPGHPGYIEYTKKWIRFYIGECRCKGIFFDCLSWAFPPDFVPRSFMRYPGDTNRMAVRFMREVYAEIKRCDPEAIMLGEGASLEGPVNVVAIASNPVRDGSVDGLGPRDFLLSLNRYGSKKLAIDQGPRLFAAGGYCTAGEGEQWDSLNQRMIQVLSSQDPSRPLVPLPGDLSVAHTTDGELLIVPIDSRRTEPRTFRLPEPWTDVDALVNIESNESIMRDQAGLFTGLAPGIYRMRRIESR